MTRPSDTTFVLTSCGRFDLLAETMLTFLACNAAPIARYLIVEDSGDASVRDVLGGLDIAIEFLVNDPPRGQMASIDRAYAKVDTPYVFHCEDDWRFLRGGFIEESRVVLDARDDVAAVTCRRVGQLHGHDYDVRALAAADHRRRRVPAGAPGRRRVLGQLQLQPGTSASRGLEAAWARSPRSAASGRRAGGSSRRQ